MSDALDLCYCLICRLSNILVQTVFNLSELITSPFPPVFFVFFLLLFISLCLLAPSDPSPWFSCLPSSHIPNICRATHGFFLGFAFFCFCFYLVLSTSVDVSIMAASYVAMAVTIVDKEWCAIFSYGNLNGFEYRWIF